MQANAQLPVVGNYRYERKFVASTLTKDEIVSLVKLHPALFSEIYWSRFVNNIYLDSPALRSYAENLHGIRDRVKARIRWYGDLFGKIEEPVLEIKSKKGLIGRKDSYPLVPFCVDRDFELETVRTVFERSDITDYLGLALGSLEASLLNRYSRRYFLSADRKYRLTLDSDLVTYQVRSRNNTFLFKTDDFVHTILELKYGLEVEHGAQSITNHFPFRMSKNSKYVNGIDSLYFW